MKVNVNKLCNFEECSLLKWLAIFLFGFIASCSTDSTTTEINLNLVSRLPDNALTAYNSGKIVILYGHNDSATSSEAHADWQAYFSDYLSASGKGVYSQKITSKVFESLSGLSVKESEFTLFLKSNSPTYYYLDFIVEPQVYIAVEAAYSGLPLHDENKVFLPDKLEY